MYQLYYVCTVHIGAFLNVPKWQWSNTVIILYLQHHYNLYSSVLLPSTHSTARCLEWNRVWWAALLGFTPHPSPPGGPTSLQLTAVTPAPLCTHLAMPPLETCTPHWAHAGTLNMNTHNISLALPISMERPPQGGRNSPLVLYKLKGAPLGSHATSLPRLWM